MAMVIGKHQIATQKVATPDGREALKVSVLGEQSSLATHLGWVRHMPTREGDGGEAWHWYSAIQGDGAWHRAEGRSEAIKELFNAWANRDKTPKQAVSLEGPCPKCGEAVRWIEDEHKRPVACQTYTTAVMCPDGIMTHGYELHRGYCKGDKKA
jgi:hypothetical protein